MDKKTIQIRRFTSADDFRAWWASDEARQAHQANPDMLKQHPLVRPWLEKLKPEETAGQVFGKYRLERKLGQGGMGLVHLAYDTVLNRRVALKTLILEDIDSTARFMREARATANLKHPNIINVYEASAIGKTYYLTMDYIEGNSLADLLTGDSASLAPKAIARIIHDIALALEYAHQQNIIHRDIKPGNILIDKSGKSYLTDFGLAKQLNGLDRSLTISGSAVGTPDYMSPEQAQGKNKDVDRRSDIFSLGATLYHALTNQLPFPGTELYDVLSSVINADPPSLSSIMVVHKDLETICLKCLEKDKSRRYQSAQELADDLKRYIDGEPILARRISAITKLWRKVTKHKAAAIGIASAVLVLLGVGIWQMIVYIDTQHKLADYRKEAFGLYHEKKYTDALAACEKVMEIAAYDAEIDDLRDKCRNEIQGREKAMETKQAEFDRRNQAKMALDRVAGSATPEDKIRAAEAALNIDPTFGEAYQVIGYVYKDKANLISIGYSPETHQELLKKSFEYFNRAIETTPTLAYSYYERGLLMADIYQNTQAAIKDFEKVLEYDPESYIGHFAKGEIERKRQNYDAAIVSYTWALRIYPGYIAAYVHRGAVYIEKSRRQRAIAARRELLDNALGDLNAALRLEPRDLFAYSSRGVAYNEKSDIEPNPELKEDLLDRSIRDYSQAAKIDPSWTETYSNRANSYVAKGDLDMAIADYTSAIKWSPKYAKAYNGRGMAYLKKGELDRALEDYDRAISLDPQYADAYANRGVVYLTKGEVETALLDFNESIRLKPEDAFAYANRGTAYAKSGDQDKAIADYTAAIIRREGYAKALNNRGKAYRDKAQSEHDINAYRQLLNNALADYDEAIRFNPKYDDAYFNRGTVYHDLIAYEQDPDTRLALAEKSIAEYITTLTYNPGNTPAYYNLGTICFQRGELDQAVDYHTQAIRLTPQYTLAYLGRALAYAKKGQLDKALADYNEAIRLNPNDADAYANRGLTYYNKARSPGAASGGLIDQAIADYTSAIRLNPAHTNAYLSRALAYRDAGNPDKAIADCTQLIKLERSNPDPYYLRASIYGRQNRFAEAIADGQAGLRLAPDHPDAAQMRTTIAEWQKKLGPK